MKEPSAIKNDLFAAHQRAEQIDHLGDPLAQIEASIDFVQLAAGAFQDSCRVHA